MTSTPPPIIVQAARHTGQFQPESDTIGFDPVERADQPVKSRNHPYVRLGIFEIRNGERRRIYMLENAADISENRLLGRRGRVVEILITQIILLRKLRTYLQ